MDELRWAEEVFSYREVRESVLEETVVEMVRS
jgi:hypothetical protein